MYGGTDDGGRTMGLKNMLAVAVAAMFWASAAVAAQPVEVKWSELAPSEGEGEILRIPENQDVIGELDIADFVGREDIYENIQVYLTRQRALQPSGSHINTGLDGKDIRLAGYVAPITIIDGELVDFLLVPFHGACIHYPPPPANQIIYIKGAEGMDLDKAHLPITVTGQLSAKPVATALADVGYRMHGVKVEEYFE